MGWAMFMGVDDRAFGRRGNVFGRRKKKEVSTRFGDSYAARKTLFDYGYARLRPSMDATLLPLTAPNRQRARGAEHCSFHDVKGRSEASLDLMERAKDNRNKVLREHYGHQNRSQAAWRW
jgi:hypothetical protein